MAVSHTQGPWRIVSDGISHWIEIEPNKIALIRAKKADRDLIAAAPDMLAVLEWWQAQMRDDDCDDMGALLDEMSAKAHAVIAQARGEA